jgi:hypothetical protein
MVKKEYVGLRLSPEMLEWIDSKIDGVHIRNRTHFIEIVLSERKKQESDE